MKYLHSSLLALTVGLVLALTFTGANAVSAAIVDVSGIEVPPVGDAVPVDPAEPDPQPVPDPAPVPQPQPNPQPQPQPQPPPPPQPPPQPDPDVLAQVVFDREKQALMEDFRMAEALMGISSASIPADDTPVDLSDKTAFGGSAIPAGLAKPGGLSPDEWRKAGEAQRTIDRLYSKWPLSGEEIKQLDQAQAQRNSLWRKAISVQGLTAEERERLRLDFHVRGLRAGEPPQPVISKDTLEKWSKQEERPAKESASSAPQPALVNPVTSYVLKEFLINRPTAGVEYIGQELADTIDGGDSFGNFLGLAKIAVAYKTEGAAAARAATADFLVGLIPYPQASFAVEGGRVYAKASFQALNKFMTEAMKATGGNFDKERFWAELKSESSQGMQGYMEWIGNGAD